MGDVSYARIANLCTWTSHRDKVKRAWLVLQSRANTIRHYHNQMLLMDEVIFATDEPDQVIEFEPEKNQDKTPIDVYKYKSNQNGFCVWTVEVIDLAYIVSRHYKKNDNETRTIKDRFAMPLDITTCQLTIKAMHENLNTWEAFLKCFKNQRANK